MEFNATLIGEMLSFALLIWFCVHFIWPYLNKAIEERQVKIAEGLSAAERAHALFFFGRDLARSLQDRSRH